MTKRQRFVYPTSEIPHKWAHATQESARNPQGNLYFVGDTIYSYRDSWPLARIYRRKVKGALFVKDNPACNLVLTNSDKYSTTTAQHQYAVNCAVRHLPQIEVPHVIALDSDDHERNLNYLVSEAADALAKAQRSLRLRRVEWLREDAERAIAYAAQYMRFFGIRRKAPVFPADAWAAALARVQRIENPDPASKDKRERASSKRRASADRKRFYAVGAARSNWRLFGEFGRIEVPREPGTRYGRSQIGATMLRVNGDEIETSQGARVPLAAAPMVWELVERARKDGGRAFLKALHRVKIGDYAVDGIDADGTLRAGCHTIPHSELRVMARALGLA